jgi:hypothetical protein
LRVMEEDRWGKDPSVQSMRRVFAAIEERQERLLQGAAVSSMDRRLGQWRKMVLHLFEQRWADSVRAGVSPSEADLVDLYAYCLTKVLETKGIAVPDDLSPPRTVADRLVGEKE